MDTTLFSTESAGLNRINVDWYLILDFTKTLIWPIVVLVITFIFKKNVAGFIDNIINIKIPGGAEVNTRRQQEIPGEIQALDQIKTEKIKKEYEDKILETAKSQKELSKQLVQTQIYLDFERIYRVIFGSQINILKRLKVNFPSGENMEDTVNDFVLTTRIYPVLASWSFIQYLTFLFNNQLIYILDGRYFITDKGKAFLTYCEILNLPKKSL